MNKRFVLRGKILRIAVKCISISKWIQGAQRYVAKMRPFSGIKVHVDHLSNVDSMSTEADSVGLCCTLCLTCK